MIILLTLLLTMSFSFAHNFKKIDALVTNAIKQKIMPGGVLIIGQNDKVLHEMVYGSGANGANQDDTIYDLASLTKVTSTATSIMLLEERGQIKLSDPLSKYFSEFTGGNKNSVTLEDVLRHHSGLASGKAPLPEESFPDFIKRVLTSPLSYIPRTKTVYSDLGFILLAELVKKVSEENLAIFTAENIFLPLKMHSTFFHVPTDLVSLCARTFPDRQCVPHDPIAFTFYPNELGHAGIFTSGHDLLQLVRMYSNEGKVDGVRILKRETVLKMITLPAGEIRGLGWDLLSDYSPAPRGNVFPKGLSYGHTGYTGTTIWIDPVSKSFYLFLSNRVLLGDSQTKAKFSVFRKNLANAIGTELYQK